jgi:hypothetical protein
MTEQKNHWAWKLSVTSTQALARTNDAVLHQSLIDLAFFSTPLQILRAYLLTYWAICNWVLCREEATWHSSIRWNAESWKGLIYGNRACAILEQESSEKEHSEEPFVTSTCPGGRRKRGQGWHEERTLIYGPLWFKVSLWRCSDSEYRQSEVLLCRLWSCCDLDLTNHGPFIFGYLTTGVLYLALSVYPWKIGVAIWGICS